MGLHVSAIRAKDLLNAVYRQLFGYIDVLAAAVVAFAGVAFGVFISELAALRRHDGGRGVVFAGDKLDMMLLAGVFGLDGSEKLRVGLFNKNSA